MGLFCVNLHFRSTDDRALTGAVNRMGVNRFRVLPAQGGWTSLYEEVASNQDDGRIRELAGDLTQDLHVAAIAFLVHDSDVACYWLFDDGRLLDDFNSCPGYFSDDDDGDDASGPQGGRPDVLLPYCQAGVRAEDLTAILTKETLFAEHLIERLAGVLGIDRQRALADYRDITRGEGPGGIDGPGDDDDDDDDDSGVGPKVLPTPSALKARLTQMLGLNAQSTASDPRVTALVQAAARDDSTEIDRLLADRVAIDAEAPAPLPGGTALGGLAQMFPGGSPQVAMTPLLAAVVNKKPGLPAASSTAGLIRIGVNPLFGTPVHVAAGAGEVELLQLLLDHGGDGKAPNRQGQSPLQVIAAGRASLERLAQARELMKTMRMNVPGLSDQLANVTLPIEGWDACERLLKGL